MLTVEFMEKKVGIVGAGVSGLLACKYALSKGFHPIVFECRSTIGGVWTKTINSTKLQTPKPLYQFSDYPWPSTVETIFPEQVQVFEYLQSYAKHFDLLKHIRFNTKVLHINYEGVSEEEMQSWALWGGNGEPFGNNGKWTVTAECLIRHSTQVDFVILCLGPYSDLPNIPKFPSGEGPEAFEGKVIHSMEYSAMDYESAKKMVKDKRVTVVGFQKSALDIAMECSTANGVEHPCTMICRTPHWNIPDDLSWGVVLASLYFNRFAELLVHKPGEGLLLAFIASMLSPVRWGISKFMERNLKKKHNLKKSDMVPNHSFSQEMHSCSISAVPKEFYESVEKGSIILKRSSSFNFCKEGIRLDDSIGVTDPIKTDLVILATGFKGDQKIKDTFVSLKFQDYIMGCPNSSKPLYRECIHPQIPQLAVIGFSQSIMNLYTSELRCRWLVELLDGNFKLPSIQKMEKDILKWDKYKKRYSGTYYKRRSCIGGIHIWYNDQLCKDMGWNPKRKKGFCAELFEPYGPMDYV